MVTDRFQKKSRQGFNSPERAQTQFRQSLGSLVDWIQKGSIHSCTQVQGVPTQCLDRVQTRSWQGLHFCFVFVLRFSWSWLGLTLGLKYDVSWYFVVVFFWFLLKSLYMTLEIIIKMEFMFIQLSLKDKFHIYYYFDGQTCDSKKMINMQLILLHLSLKDELNNSYYFDSHIYDSQNND